MQRRMNPVRIFVERRMAFLTEKLAFIEGGNSSSVMRRKVAYHLSDSEIFDDAVRGTVVEDRVSEEAPKDSGG